MEEQPRILENNQKKSNKIGKKIILQLLLNFLKDKKKYLSLKLYHIISRCYNFDIITLEQKTMINNILDVNQIKVGDIMVPRNNITAIDKKITLEEIKKIILDKEHSRMPVYNKNLDNILGFVHCKDLIKFIKEEEIEFNISSIIRKILYVPHSMKIIDLLVKMRSSGVHMAIILDEYGGVDGIITIEDIIEEIIGDIKDEHDVLEDNIYLTKKQISDNIFHFGGRVDIEEVENMIGCKISEEEDYDFETISGFMFSTLKKIPKVRESIKQNNLSFKVLDSDSKSIKLIEVAKLQKNDT